MAATDGKKASAESVHSIMVPSSLLDVNGFVLKIYFMVDDPANHELVSWRPMNNGFIVKDEKEFARVLLPKYFRHNKFKNFYRQLNYYGFKKVDSNLWEFENESFVRGQLHLLNNIVRRDPAREKKQQQQQQTYGQSSIVEELDEFGSLSLDEEVESIKKDNNVIIQELVKSRKQLQTTATQLEAMVQRLDEVEKQLEMMSILLKDVNTPEGDIFDLDSVWDNFSINEILKSIDHSGGQFSVSSPSATDAREMDSTPLAALQQKSDAKLLDNEDQSLFPPIPKKQKRVE